MKLNKYKTPVAILLALTVAAGGTGAVIYAQNAADNSASESVAVTEESSPAASAAVSGASKSETVYVIANADGSVQKLIVSDWLKNASGEKLLADYTELSDVKNVKGDGQFNGSQWDADGDDIYYQGTSDKALPVEMKITYYLDGNEISPEALAGKSGKVKIRFDYSNTMKKTVEVNGESCEIYVPFAVVTGTVLDNDKFTNIEITNGKLINDGDRSIAAGFALPGLQETLGIDAETLEIPAYVEITADVTDFELETTLTVATDELFAGTELGGELDGLDTSDLDKLADGVKQLMDGSSELYDGLSLLLEKSGELSDAVNELNGGSSDLAGYTAQLADGAQAVADGASQLSGYIDDLGNGLGQLDSNSEQLVSGAAQVFNTLLDTANASLKASGLDVPALTIENYSEVLKNVLANLDENAVYSAAKAQVTSAVEAQRSAVVAGVTAAVKKGALEQILAGASITNGDGSAMTAEQYQQAVSAGYINSATASAVSAQLDATMATSAVQSRISTLTEQKIASLISDNMNGSTVQSKLSAAKAGAESIKALLAQLDSYNEFYEGVIAYTDGVASANSGAQQLEAGAATLSSGAAELSESAAKIAEGAAELNKYLTELNEAAAELPDGVKKLTDGSMQLSDGIKTLYDEGISKLLEFTEGDLKNIGGRLEAALDYACEYDTFGGKAEGTSGAVRFVWRTADISTED